MTETDEAVERYVRDAIALAWPTHSFIGEESHAGGDVVEFTVRRFSVPPAVRINTNAFIGRADLDL